jgi:lipoprotein
MKKVFLYAFLAISLVSCGGLAKQFVTFTGDQPLQEGKSRIYVMFCNYSMSSTPIISLFCNENLIGTIDHDGYLAFDVPSG